MDLFEVLTEEAFSQINLTGKGKDCERLNPLVNCANIQPRKKSEVKGLSKKENDSTGRSKRKFNRFEGHASPDSGIEDSHTNTVLTKLGARNPNPNAGRAYAELEQPPRKKPRLDARLSHPDPLFSRKKDGEHRKAVVAADELQRSSKRKKDKKLNNDDVSKAGSLRKATRDKQSNAKLDAKVAQNKVLAYKSVFRTTYKEYIVLLDLVQKQANFILKLGEMLEKKKKFGEDRPMQTALKKEILLMGKHLKSKAFQDKKRRLEHLENKLRALKVSIREYR